MLDGLESEQMCKPTVAPFHNQTHPQSCTTGGSNQINLIAFQDLIKNIKNVMLCYSQIFS